MQTHAGTRAHLRRHVCAPAQALNVMCDVGQVYFYNSETKESLWEHPMDEHYRQLVVYWRDAYSRFASPSTPLLLHLPSLIDKLTHTPPCP